MKHTGSLALGLGLFLGLPAFTNGGGLPDTLEGALNETMKALEVLGQLKDELDGTTPLPGGTVESLTEAPSGTAPERSGHLERLRDEVSALQVQLDTRQLREGAAGPELTTGVTGPGAVTTGLPSAFVRGMSGGDSSQTRTAQSTDLEETGQQTAETPTEAETAQPAGTESTASETTTPAAETEHQPAPSPEGKGYSANPLRQAKACYRAGRYQQGLDILEAVTPFTEGDYWRAKLLDRLGRTEEALELFRSVEIAEDAGALAESAKQDAELAEWLRDFRKKEDGQ